MQQATTGAYKFDIPEGGSFITWTFIGDVMISFSKAGEMPEARFNEYYSALKSHTFTHCFGMGLGVSRLTSTQRKQFSQVMKGKEIVVVIDNAVTRGIITALGWLGLNIKSFDWNNIESAARSIVTTSTTSDEILKTALALREASLDSSQLASSM